MKTKEYDLKRLEDMKREKCAVEEELKSLIKQSSDDKTALEKNLRQENDMITHERDNDRRQYEAEINAKENAIERLEEELKHHKTQSSHEKFALEKVMKRLRQDNDNISDEREKERKQYMTEKKENENTLKRMQHERDKAIQQCKAEKAAKDDALSRLSTLASSRLRDNNPNITDLSDQNRPTKIAEKMAELYDNQWTDAFDALEQTDKNEKEIITLLLESLMTAYGECFKLANDNFFEKVQRVIECPKIVDEQLPAKVVLSDQLKQEIKEFRKNQATKVWKEIEGILDVIRSIEQPNIG
ncbi:interaptin-like [Ruditapes philippinarum]|uniref:interaptin-like n=1 Tax=Ruditapes philippinarum TaxID=129788 RepID=UPI00295B7E89|nr:interaptin-like [Ruditapes philippinarum]